MGREDGILLSVMLGAFLLTSPINPSKTVAADSCTLFVSGRANRKHRRCSTLGVTLLLSKGEKS